MPQPPGTVEITDDALALERLLAIARGAPVTLGADARARIAAGRATLAAALADGQAVYGVTTQVGHGKDVHLGDEALHRQQEMLVLTHAGGFGPPLPTELVRAAMAVRLAGLARGGAGVSPAAADVLVAMLNAGVHPIVPTTGSVGAGDLGQMAWIAQVAIGRGRAELDGERVTGAEALRRAGIEPLVLEGKDGLALMSSNGFSIGQAAFVVERAERVAEAADQVAALSLEAIRGNPQATAPAVGEARPFAGQAKAAGGMRAALRGSDLLQPGGPASIQDALSFRVAPQVHGALREAIAFLRRAVEIELDAAADNPLVWQADGTILHNGNFHPVVLAIGGDLLRLALAHVGQLSDRRMTQVWDAFFRGLAARQHGGPAEGALPELVGLALRYPAAAAYSELKQLAAPASLDAPPLDMGVEDHATSAPLSIRKADDALALLEDVLAVELLLARDLLATMPERPTLGAGTGALVRVVDELLVDVADHAPDAVHAALRERFPAPGFSA